MLVTWQKPHDETRSGNGHTSWPQGSRLSPSGPGAGASSGSGDGAGAGAGASGSGAGAGAGGSGRGDVAAGLGVAALQLGGASGSQRPSQHALSLKQPTALRPSNAPGAQQGKPCR